uniref:natterin-3-like n=1 Tax=Monopterus albus TaxID=43700 RepID=UPI0009B4A450|nr:natterin-3-like [Monopterus albus]
MKLLLLLLALSWASLQDTVGTSSQPRDASLLNPNLEDRVPEITVNTLTTRRQLHLHPAKFEQKRLIQLSSSVSDYGKLKRQEWFHNSSSVPNGTVSIYNENAQRIEYVCHYNCYCGFYNPDLGSCRYTSDSFMFHTNSFHLLVNEDNFEILEWKDTFDSSLPVSTCSDLNRYVGENKHSLMPVMPRSDPQVPPETIRVSAITNNDCSPVSKTTTLSKTNRVEKRWDVGGSITAGVKTTFSAGIPSIASGGVEVSVEVTFQASGGHTYVEQVQHSISVKLDVPPNHSCKVRLLGYKYKADIPFTARLTRTCKSGATTSTSISGTYNSVEVGEVRAVVDRCEPVPDARPCS